MRTCVARKNEIGFEVLAGHHGDGRRHGRLFVAADQCVFAFRDSARNVRTACAGEQRRKVQSRAVLSRRLRLSHDRHRHAFALEFAEVFGAAAEDVGQNDFKGLVLGGVIRDQLDRDLDFIDRTGERQHALRLCVVDARDRRSVHGLVMHRDVVGRVARTRDLRLDKAVLTVCRNRFVRKTDRAFAVRVVVRYHERQRVARVAQKTALAAADREQTELRQLRNLVLDRRHTDVFDRLAVGERHRKLHDIPIVFERHGAERRLVRNHEVFRHRLRIRDRFIDLAEHGSRAGDLVAVLQQAAEIIARGLLIFEVPDVAPGDDQFRRIRIFDVMPAVLTADLPAIRFRFRVRDPGQRQNELVFRRYILRRIRKLHFARRRFHIAFRFGDAERLIGCDRIRVFDLDQHVLLTGCRIVVDLLGSVFVRRDRRRVHDAYGRSADGAAETVDGNQDRFRNGLSVGGQRAGFGNVRLIVAERERAVRIDDIPVFLRRDIAVFGSDHDRWFFFGRFRRRFRVIVCQHGVQRQK